MQFVASQRFHVIHKVMFIPFSHQGCVRLSVFRNENAYDGLLKNLLEEDSGVTGMQNALT